MHRPSWFHPLVSLTGALGLLAISVWLDNFLALRQKFAQASFEYNQLFLTLIIGSLLIFIGWFILGWFVLYFERPSRGLSIAFLILGAFVVWVPYVLMWVGVPIVRLGLYELTRDLAQASGIFIAVLGGLGLLHKPPQLVQA